MSDVNDVVAELLALASEATTGNWYIYTGEDNEPISLAADGVGPNGGWVGKSIARLGVPYRDRTAEQIAADAAYLKAVQPAAVMRLLDLLAHQAARLEEVTSSRDFFKSAADGHRDHIAELKAALTAAEAEKERYRDAVKGALDWDVRRSFVMPYRVRDHLRAALSPKKEQTDV